MSSTAYSKCTQNDNKDLDATIASNNIYAPMDHYSLHPIYGHYSYGPTSSAAFTESRTHRDTSIPTITCKSCCNFTCINSGKSIHDLKSLATTAISMDCANWRQINKNTGLQNKPTTRLDINYFIEECKRSLDNNILPFIPVVIDDKIEYIKIIQLRSNYAGIGFRSNHVNDQLLNGFYGGCAGYESLPRDILGLIMKFCTILEVSRIHLDPDYILDHHKLLPANKQYDDIIEVVAPVPFISDLTIEYGTDKDEIELEEADGLCVQSDWEYGE